VRITPKPLGSPSNKDHTGMNVDSTPSQVTPTLPSVGFIGLGAMGAPMAMRLVTAGVDLAIRDLDPSAEVKVAAHGSNAKIRERRDIARSDVVILMLRDTPAVEGEVLGPQGLLESMRPGSVLVDMSSSDPVSTQALALAAESVGVQWLDAPVSGGVRGAVSGELTIMVGGDPAVLESLIPLFRLMGSRVDHVGGPGAGHAVKVLNNLLAAIGLVGAAEVLLTATRFGVDPKTALNVINHSTGRNHATEMKVAQFILNRHFDAGFAAELMLKDMRTAVSLSAANGVATTVGEAALDVCSRAVTALPPGADHTAVVTYLEQLSGAVLADSVREQ
jgi:3-hydroxyisobutyrate dehydrogenase